MVNCVGLAETNKNQIQIFPNPSNTSIVIQCADMTVHQVAVFDLTGRTCQHKIIEKNTYKSIEYNVADLASGVYELRIFCATNTYSVKLVKE